MKTTEVAIPEATAIQSNTPADMIRMAVAGNADLDKLSKLLELQERWEANEAKKAYNSSMVALKSEMPMVHKDKFNAQYKSKYSTIDNLVNTLTPYLSKYGFSASWDMEQNGVIKVTCTMTHIMGHTEKRSATAPADKSGAKNDIQQIKSTWTYLRGITFESVLGTASSDANIDDDGGKPVEYITNEQASTLCDLLNANPKATEDKFLAYMKVDMMEHILKADYNKAALVLKVKE